MVLVIGDVLLADAERMLARLVQDIRAEPIGVQALGAWLLAEEPSEAVRAVLQGDRVLRSYDQIAAAALFVDPRHPRVADGFEWLRSTALRRGHHPAPICLDVTAQLALAIGGASDEEMRRWVSEALEQGRASAHPSWLIGPVERLLGLAGDVPADVGVALSSRGCWERDEVLEMELLREVQRGWTPESPLRAAFALAALRWVRRHAAVALPSRATPQDVVTVLEGVTAGLAEWTWETKGRKSGAAPMIWDVTSEYHVQNLLWLVLRPLFPDLKKEEYVPSRGHHHPRTDLLIPSLRLVIEVKYLDKTGRRVWRERTEEVKADVTGYLAPGSPADQLIVFLWDDTASTEQHDTFRQGFDGLPGVIGVVVVARPGRMVRTADSGDSNEESEP